MSKRPYSHALKAALPSADEADKPEIQSQIDIYESALADPAYQNNFDPSRDPTAVEAYHWQGGRACQTPMSAGTLRSNTTRVTSVLTTVRSTGLCLMSPSGMKPDAVFDADAGTGGWMPADYQPPTEDQ